MAGPCIDVTKERIRDWARWQRCLSDGSPTIWSKKSNFAQATARSIDYPDYPDDAAYLDRVIAAWAKRYNEYKAGAGDRLFACLKSINDRVSPETVCDVLKIDKSELAKMQEEAVDITHIHLNKNQFPEYFN